MSTNNSNIVLLPCCDIVKTFSSRLIMVDGKCKSVEVHYYASGIIYPNVIQCDNECDDHNGDDE